MPHYNPGYRGEYTNNLTLPVTLEHVLQFVSLMKTSVWNGIVEKAKDLKLTPQVIKIKPTSYNKIIKAKTPKHLSYDIIKEHNLHSDFNSDFHISGGVHEALNNILLEISKDVGALNVSNWVGIEQQHHKLTGEQIMFARLIQQTYIIHRLDTFTSTWKRLDEFDTKHSCIWFNKKICLLIVVGPQTRYRKIELIVSPKVSYPTQESIDMFVELYPGLPLTVVTHSYGFETFLQIKTLPPITHFYAFNPAAVTPTVNPHKTTYFINYNDVIGNQIGDDVVFGGVVEARAVAHTVSQWVFEETPPKSADPVSTLQQVGKSIRIV